MELKQGKGKREEGRGKRALMQKALMQKCNFRYNLLYNGERA
jgi:hypothetical protein